MLMPRLLPLVMCLREAKKAFQSRRCICRLLEGQREVREHPLTRTGRRELTNVVSAINLKDAYRPLARPLPSPCHANYPFYTPGGEDKRWLGNEDLEENGRQWVGPMMYVMRSFLGENCRTHKGPRRITAQLIGPQTKYFEIEEGRTFLQDIDLVVGPGRNQYASLTWEDMKAIAPWVELTNMVNGPGLGH